VPEEKLKGRSSWLVPFDGCPFLTGQGILEQKGKKEGFERSQKHLKFASIVF
jgi:hypothetical protein